MSTRIEEFLRACVDGVKCALKPLTRVETLLSALNDKLAGPAPTVILEETELSPHSSGMGFISELPPNAKPEAEKTYVVTANGKEYTMPAIASDNGTIILVDADETFAVMFKPDSFDVQDFGGYVIVEWYTEEVPDTLTLSIVEKAEAGSGGGDLVARVDGLEEDVNALSEEMVKSVNGFQSDETGEVTIKYDRTTEKAYRHPELSEYAKKITVYANDVYATAPYVFMGKNYWPTTEQVAGKYTQHGLTFETDKHSFTIKGTATTGSMFSLSPDGATEYWEIPEEIRAGEQFALYVFGKASDKYSFFAKVRVYDASKNYIRQVQSALDVGKTSYKSGAFEIPENAKYFTFQLAYSNGNTYDNTMFPVFVKVGTEVISDVAFADGIAECNTENPTLDICSAPYESVVKYAQNLKEYIDYGANSVSFDLTTIHNDMSYVSPEMFGAYADGKHDDTAPIQTCIDYAIVNKKKVLGGNAYITNSPIIVDGNYHNIELGEIYYSGTDSAVIVTGSYNNIRVGRIYADYGTCIRLVSDKQTTHNNLNISYMRSQKNSVEYIRTANNCFGNRLQFEYIKADAEYNCIYQSPEIDTAGNYNLNLNNNNFIGGQLAGGQWGVYGAKGTDTYLTVQFEGVSNGIYMDGVGTCRVISPRYAELVQLAYTSGTLLPVEGQGTLFAVESPFGATLPQGISKGMTVQIWPPNTQVSAFNVDVSNAPIEVVDNGETIPLPKIYPGAYTVGEKLRHRNGNVYADSFMVYGRHIMIKDPIFKVQKTVSVSDAGYAGDYRITGDEATEFTIYSRFIIAESGCVYTLPPSYDMLAFDEFTVEQPEGTSCTFKDWRGTVIFDGAQYGAGTYKVVARIKDGVLWDYYDNRNQVWDIYKQEVLVATMPQAT